MRSTFFLVAILYVLAGCKTAKQTVSSKDAFIDSSLVYAPKAGEYASMRIPALVISKKGTLLAFCEGRINNASDWGDMNLLLRRSTDGGKTWGPYQVVAAKKTGGPAGNPAPVVADDGTIHLLYQRDYAFAYHTQSTDDGLTWSAAEDITYAFDKIKPQYNWNVLATGPGHAIQLKSGRLLVPVWLAASEKIQPHRSHGPSSIATIYSDDNGKTWNNGAISAYNTPDFKNPNENMAVQLNDGRVMINVRLGSKVNRRGIIYSPDGISNWSVPTYDTALFDPVCMATINKVPLKEGGNAMIFINPDSRHIEKTPRKNLVVKLSYDEGKTWPVKKVLEPGFAGYSDVAVAPDGTIYCLYETNDGKDWNYSLLLKTFTVGWIGR
jgi:sialidase-1